MKVSKLQTEEVLKQFLSKENGLNEVLEIFMNSLMYSERDVFLKSQEGTNKGNGYREGQVYGRGRQLQLRIPRDRMGQFYPVLLALLRDQDSQLHDLSFMLYSKGLTTRDIGEVLEVIYGKNYSKSTISDINKSFYEQMEDWRNRELEQEYLAIYIDAIWQKVKRDTIRSEAFYILMGLKKDFTREIIGIVNIPTESATGWELVLNELKQRGVSKVHLFVSDGLKSLETAVSKVFNQSVHQKCIVHLQRNILAAVRASHKAEIAADLRAVLNPDDEAYTKSMAMEQLANFADKWGKLYRHIKKLPDKEDIEYYFNYLDFDYRIRRMIYTTNWIERFNKSCRRTLKIRNSFPNPEAALALITSVAIEKGEKKYAYPIHNFKFEEKFMNETCSIH
jgi:transposase-like protein